MSTQNRFAAQRERLKAQLPPHAVALVTSNDIFPSNTDGTLPFFQETNLFYLTGIKQDETTVVLCPGHPDPALREVLFIKEVDELFVSWNGPRLSRQEAAEISGIQTVFWEKDLDGLLKRIVPLGTAIYLYTNEHPRSINIVPTRGDRLLEKMKILYPLHQLGRLYPLLAAQRNVKLEDELQQMRQACAITEAGFRRVLKFMRPGVNEKQVEAELIHEYMQYGASWADYEPIVASGPDTCILHYRANNKICRDGDLVLIDAAAAWDYYNADLTRTIPVNGRYTKRQKACYNAVLSVMKKIKERFRAGRLLADLQAECNELLIEALVSLQLCTPEDIREKGASHFLKKYCRHNISHFIGLDVHDIGYHHEPLPAGATLTLEPGIYIEEEGIGIRIENNLVITEDEPIDLMQTIPIEAEEIEELMNR